MKRKAVRKAKGRWPYKHIDEQGRLTSPDLRARAEALAEAADGAIDGVLAGEIFINYERKRHARGFVFSDQKGRFFDGDWICTTEVKMGDPKESGVFRTRNSTYQLIDVPPEALREVDLYWRRRNAGWP